MFTQVDLVKYLWFTVVNRVYYKHAYVRLSKLPTPLHSTAAYFPQRE